MDSPILVHNELQIGQLRQAFAQHKMLIIYCNPKIHGKDTYNQVLKSIAEARRLRPFNNSVSKNDQKKTKSEIMYVVSACPTIDPIKLNETDKV